MLTSVIVIQTEFFVKCKLLLLSLLLLLLSLYLKSLSLLFFIKKNIYIYIGVEIFIFTLKVYEEAGLSPGIHTKKHADKQFKRRLKVGERSRLPSTKRRRLQLKQERNVTQCALQALEGDTYQSGIITIIILFF